jgi:integrase
MPCLIKRNNGVFYIVSFKRGSGKRVWRSLYTQDRYEAEAIFNEKKQTCKGKGISFQDFYHEVKPMIELDSARNTLDFYEYIVKKISSIIGNKRLTAYTILDFERYKLSRSKEIRKVTVNKEIRTIRALFQRAVTLGFIEKNPAKNCKLLKVDEKRPTYLTPEQFNILLDMIQDRNFKEIVIFAVMTIMRAGEIAHLEWPDVNFAEGQIAVINKPDHRVKTGKERIVPMNDYIFSMLRTRRQSQGCVFENSKGEKWKVKALSDRFRKYRRKAGLPEGTRFHSLRHTGLTWMHHKGVPSESMRQIAGHSSIQTTQIYTHALPQHLLAAANTLNKCIQSSTRKQIIE